MMRVPGVISVKLLWCCFVMLPKMMRHSLHVGSGPGLLISSTMLLVRSRSLADCASSGFLYPLDILSSGILCLTYLVIVVIDRDELLDSKVN